MTYMDTVKEDMEKIYEKKNIDWEEFSGCTFLITGAYGMLATYFVYFLIYLNEEKGMNVRIIVQGRTKEKMHARFGNYLSKPYMKETYFSLVEPITQLEDADYIIHAASLASPNYYEKIPVEVEEPNAVGTYFLLKYAGKCNARGFLYFSSASIYGNMGNSEKIITENTYGIVDPLNSHSCYDESKRMGETWCASFAREYGVPVRIVRPAHTYGPTMDVENDPRVFASFVRDILHNNDIVMHSDGTAYRTFCYIADAVYAFFLVLLKGELGEAYNICNASQYISIGELAEILVSLVNEKKLKVICRTRPKGELYLENAKDKESRFSEEKLRNLGWSCDYDVRSGFSRVINALSDKMCKKDISNRRNDRT